MENYFIPINELCRESEVCFAHFSAKEGRRETLVEHTELCQKYFLKIMKQKKLESIFWNFQKFYLPNLSQAALDLFYKMMINVVTMHDCGKLNPVYQRDKMKYEWMLSVSPDTNIGTKHSILSAAFYLDYFLKEIKSLENIDEQRRLKDLVYVHSFLIARHHSEVTAFQDYLNSFEESDRNENALGWRACMWLKRWKKETTGEDQIFKISSREKKYALKRLQSENNKENVFLYGYARLLYSLLVAADYYATSEFMGGVETKDFGEVQNMEYMVKNYEKTEIVKSTRDYERDQYPMDDVMLKQQKDINILRMELFLDAERELNRNLVESIFYLEAPTGSGKSNTAFDLSFQLLKQNKYQKIFYIYPFNTLVEQNIESLKKIFDGNEEILAQMAVVNSIVPIKETHNTNDDQENDYQRALLDRQFLNYPIVLSTHVMLFRTLFGNNREDLFGFHQMCHSVLVLDEIQSYQNDLWNEMITFLKGFAQLMDIKIIIMSATLPNLELLSEDKDSAAALIKRRMKYFNHSLFAKRVEINYDLLQESITLELLASHVCGNVSEKKKILIELIKKDSAYRFFDLIRERTECEVLLMTGDSSILERKMLIEKLGTMSSVILVATQVIEAGVDIDMDIGYKDISRLDSEEQFMGRINRSCKKSGIVYFFNLDNAANIYKKDIRINSELTLENKEMHQILRTKEFQTYYEKILQTLNIRKKKANNENLKAFFCSSVGNLDFFKVDQKMRLIQDDQQKAFLYLSRTIIDHTGQELDGAAVWKDYGTLLKDQEMDYAEKTIKLSKVRSKMNAFLYQVSMDHSFHYDDQIGDIYYVQDGDAYFENGCLNHKMLSQDELFL